MRGTGYDGAQMLNDTCPPPGQLAVWALQVPVWQSESELQYLRHTVPDIAWMQR